MRESQNVIGQRLQAARLAARWSVQDLCDVCNDDVADTADAPAHVGGIQPTAVRRWEQGEYEPSVAQLRVLAWALNNPAHGRAVSIGYLLGLEEQSLETAPEPLFDCPEDHDESGFMPTANPAFFAAGGALAL